MQTAVLVIAVLILVAGIFWAMIALLNAALRRDAALRSNPLLASEDNAYLGGVAAAAGSGAAACGGGTASSCS